MKIFNYSKSHCDRGLWHDIADRLGLGGEIRDADLAGRRELSVVVRRPRPRCGEQRTEYGCCTPPRIDISPCRNCTSGTIFHTFLGCAAAMWMHQHHWDLYFTTWLWDFGERFADSAFTILGGKTLERHDCERWRWHDGNVVADRLDQVHRIIGRMNKIPEAKVRSFRFPSPAAN